MSTPIQVQLHTTNNNKNIAVVTLNNPKALNALNLEMTRAIHQHLTDWIHDDTIAMIILHGMGDKAMCAGGDIKSLYAGDTAYAKTFFEEEYGLMYAMHTYPKPILAWGNGIVMGGGLGLFSASSHKVVTENTLMAMPEVSIGLFPDAGGSHFLNRLTNKVGLFIGLTGLRFGGADALDVCLADFGIRHDEFDKVLQALLGIDFCEDNAQNYCLLSDCLYKFHNTANLPKGYIDSHFDEINELVSGDDLLSVDTKLQNHLSTHPHIQAAIDSYKHGSPITKALTWHIYHHIKNAPDNIPLKDIFDMETKVAVNCLTKGDFKEGVRALLIDKDKNPKWQYTGIKDIPSGFIDGFFDLD